MSTRHRIRLAGPWEAEIIHSSSHVELTHKHLKAVLGGGVDLKSTPFLGDLNLRRNFNLPTGLDNQSTVWLCTEGFPDTPDPFQISLNQQAMNRTDGAPASGQMEFSITDALESFNRIEILLSCSTADAPVQINADATSALVTASVWLEIE